MYCIFLSYLIAQFEAITKDMTLRREFESLKFKLSDASLTLLPEYKERLKVLYDLHYIDTEDTVKLKVVNQHIASNLNIHEMCLKLNYIAFPYSLYELMNGYKYNIA